MIKTLNDIFTGLVWGGILLIAGFIVIAFISHGSSEYSQGLNRNTTPVTTDDDYSEFYLTTFDNSIEE